MEYAKLIYIRIQVKLFRSLHSTQECMVVQKINLNQSYINADIIHFIDTSYIKTENTTILEWLRSITEVIFIIAYKYENIDQATLWIPTSKSSRDPFIHELDVKQSRSTCMSVGF